MYRNILRVLVWIGLAFASTAFAANAPAAPPVQGLYLTTSYPSITARPGSSTTLPLVLSNRGEAPVSLAVHVEGVPHGWTATLLGGGQPVGAAMPPTDGEVPLNLQLKIPADATIKPETLAVVAESANWHLKLPISVQLAERLPAKLAVTAKLPELKGSAQSSFAYDVTVKNESGVDMVVSLAADAPQYFQATFTEQFGSQQLSSVPIKAGESKDFSVKVTPPNTVEPGTYPITVKVAAGDAHAETALKMVITGQPQLALAGRNGLLSASAEVGKATAMPVVVANTGSAAAADIKLSSSAPSGWKVQFTPDTIADLAPGKTKEVQASITPSSESLAGEYQVSLSALSQGQSVSSDFRISVVTSTLWGIIGAIIIAIAVLILVGAVARYGRR